MEIFENTPVIDRNLGATTSAQNIAAANSTRRGAEFQNVSTVNIGFNEGGTAVIGSLGTWTVLPNGWFKARKNLSISVVSASGTANITGVEW